MGDFFIFPLDYPHSAPLMRGYQLYPLSGFLTTIYTLIRYNLYQDFGGANWIELRTLSDIPTGGVANLADDETGFNIGCDGCYLIINSMDQIRVNIFRCDGSLVRSLTVEPGETRVSGLERGIYIVNRNKIVIR